MNRPRLVVVLPLEGDPELRFEADSHAGELALRLWLRRASSVGALPDAIVAVLDWLDEHDWPQAA